MTRVGTTDQILALVRAQLQRMGRRERGESAGKAGGERAETLTRRQRVQALAEMRGLSDEQFGRDLVRALLTDELGEGVAATPGFQSVIERTYSALEADPETRAAIRGLRNQMQEER